MSPDRFPDPDPDPDPDPGSDSEEPGDFPLLPEEEGAGPEDEGEFPVQQGLYVTLPAEQLTLAGFAQNGEADTMAPGGLLATVVQVVAGEDGSCAATIIGPSRPKAGGSSSQSQAS